MSSRGRSRGVGYILHPTEFHCMLKNTNKSAALDIEIVFS
jgi:hypothetical protein